MGRRERGSIAASPSACFGIYGTVTRTSCSETACEEKPLEAATIVARSGGLTWQTTSSYEGTYRLAPLPAGQTYTISATYSDGTATKYGFEPASTSVALNGDRKKVDFAACDFAPQAKALAADLTKAGPLAWVECTTEMNRALVRESYRKTPFLQHITEDQRNQMAAFPDLFLPAIQPALRRIN